MATEDRPPSEPLMERLAREPYAFDFFQAVRRLECAHPNHPRIGQSSRLAEDPVRFAQAPSLAFAPSTIESFQPGPQGGVPRLSVFFLGVTGPNGPMPLHFTEYVRERARSYHDASLRDFLDVFHHRMISLFYRAWAASQCPVSRDRPGEDRYAAYIGSLAGLGSEPFRRRDSVQDEAKLFYAGRLSCLTRNAEGLRAILEDYFAVPTRVEQFVGRWIELPVANRFRLGETPETGALGRSTFVGERFWDRQQTFRIVFGPLSLADLRRFLPRGRSFRRLADWIRNYVGRQLRWEAQLVLRREEVPAVRLGEQGEIGWTTWLSSRPFERDAEDLIVQPVEV